MKNRFGLLLVLAAAAGAVAVEHIIEKKLEASAGERESLRQATQGLKHSNDQLNALYNIFAEITETLSLQFVVEATLRETLNLMDAHGAVLWLVEGGRLIPQGGLTYAGRPIKGLEPQNLGEGLMGRTVKRGRTLRIDESNKNLLPPQMVSQGVHSGILVPLIVGARVVGLLNCWSVKQNAFTDEDQRILEMMASQVATAVVAADAMDVKDRQAHHDALTSLPNRHQLNEDMTGHLKLLAQSGRRAVVAMLDIDNFKAFNDDYGHKVGDITLQKVASVLRNSVRESDRVYRYGGEEFVMVFADAGAEEGLTLAERVRQTIEAAPPPGSTAQAVRQVTVSIGLACLPDDSSDFAALIDMADRAMYQAKVSGRNRVAVWQAGHEDAKTADQDAKLAA
jgi:diguanylate cyclase (GGDEF)-like protein